MLFLKKKVKRINFILNITIIITLITITCLSIFLCNRNVRNKLEQQADLCILNISRINTSSEFLINYLANLIISNENYLYQQKISKILSSVKNSNDIETIIIWIDADNRLIYSESNTNIHYIDNLEKIIPVKDLIMNAHKYRINPYIIHDIHFHHQKLFSIITYLQQNKKKIGFLIVGMSLPSILKNLNVIPKKYDITVSILDINNKIHKFNKINPFDYQKFNQQFVNKKLTLLKHIEESSLYLLLTYDKDKYITDICARTTLNIIIISIIYTLIKIYENFVTKKLIKPITELYIYLQNSNNALHNYKIRELNAIKNKLVAYNYLQKSFLLLKEKFDNQEKQLIYNQKIISEFSARVSHEMKTPLNVIMLYSEIIKNEMFGKIDNKKYVDYARNVYGASKSLITMIEDLLFLNKIQNNSLTLSRFQKVDLKNLLQNISNKLIQYAKEKNINFEKKIANNLPLILLDIKKTERALYHILHNAIKFNQEKNGFVSIYCETQKINFHPVIAIIIINNGPPIHNINEAILPFYQIDSGLNRKFDGLGIGLTIAKKFIEIQGGKLFINSQTNQTEVKITFKIDE